MTKARNLSLLSTVEVGATADQTKSDIDALGIAADITAGDTAARAGRKNIISNGSFQISQRGNYTSTTTAANNTYYVDRFRITSSAVNVSNQHTTVSIGGVSKRAYKVTATSAATGYFGSRHGFELLDLEVGATYTISCWMRSNRSNARIRQDSIGGISANSTMSHTGGGDWEKITFTVDSTNTVANCALQFICYPVYAVSVGDYIEIADVQMEVGSVATDFEHRSYGEELALCQRYYEVVDITNVAYGGYNSDVSRRLTVLYKVSKRVAPTTWALGGLSGWTSGPSVGSSKVDGAFITGNTTSACSIESLTAEAEL